MNRALNTEWTKIIIIITIIIIIIIIIIVIIITTTTIIIIIMKYTWKEPSSGRFALDEGRSFYF